MSVVFCFQKAIREARAVIKYRAKYVKDDGTITFYTFSLKWSPDVDKRAATLAFVKGRNKGWMDESQGFSIRCLNPDRTEVD